MFETLYTKKVMADSSGGPEDLLRVAFLTKPYSCPVKLYSVPVVE
jgi:hypothetical protein